MVGSSQDGNCLVVWDCRDEAVVQRLEKHGQTVRSLCSDLFSTTVVSASFDKTMKVWV